MLLFKLSPDFGVVVQLGTHCFTPCEPRQPRRRGRYPAQLRNPKLLDQAQRNVQRSRPLPSPPSIETESGQSAFSSESRNSHGKQFKLGIYPMPLFDERIGLKQKLQLRLRVYRSAQCAAPVGLVPEIQVDFVWSTGNERYGPTGCK